MRPLSLLLLTSLALACGDKSGETDAGTMTGTDATTNVSTTNISTDVTEESVTGPTGGETTAGSAATDATTSTTEATTTSPTDATTDGTQNECDVLAAQYTAKYEACGILTGTETSTDGTDGTDSGYETDPSGYETSTELECTDEIVATLTCYVACIRAASCEAISGEDPAGSDAFYDCILGCAL